MEYIKVLLSKYRIQMMMIYFFKTIEVSHYYCTVGVYILMCIGLHMGKPKEIPNNKN